LIAVLAGVIADLAACSTSTLACGRPSAGHPAVFYTKLQHGFGVSLVVENHRCAGIPT
jgi:hypothetical protein